MARLLKSALTQWAHARSLCVWHCIAIKTKRIVLGGSRVVEHSVYVGVGLRICRCLRLNIGRHTPSVFDLTSATRLNRFHWTTIRHVDPRVQLYHVYGYGHGSQSAFGRECEGRAVAILIGQIMMIDENVVEPLVPANVEWKLGDGEG